MNSKGALGPPHSSEAEKAVLGAVLRESQLLHTVIGKANLLPDYFYLDSHRRIFSLMLEQDGKGEPIDLLSMAERLQSGTSDREKVSSSYLIELIEASPLTQNIEYYAELIKNKHYLRRIIDACNSTLKHAYASDGDINFFIEQVEKEFLAIASDQDRGKGLVSAKDALIPTLEELERRITSDSFITGISSGFNDLDRTTGGWQKSDLIILAARPGMGKSALALNWLVNAVKTNKDINIAIFTLEMSKEQLLERILSSEGRIDSAKLRTGDLSDDDQDRLMHAAREIDRIGRQIVIDETPGISLMELRSRCRRFQRENGLDMIIIDYLQLMTGSMLAQKQSREREISEISVGLKNMAKELAVPVIALAQLNRGPDARPDKKPRISDLRESGSMEQDADQILFVYRDEYYNPNSEHVGKAEVLIAKNRHGEVGSAFLAWLPNYVSFHNLMKD